MFEILGLEPGDYSALAWDDIEPGAHQNREFVERFEARAVKVTIERGSTREIALSVIPAN
jgi:hypothetical protein